jgi:hypothetical protein
MFSIGYLDIATTTAFLKHEEVSSFQVSLLDLISLIICGEESKLWNTPSCSFFCPLCSYFLSLRSKYSPHHLAVRHF